jgi:CSLREA domain-containing protein
VTTFTVNSTADDPIASATGKTCHATNGKCTLRAAVTAADNLGKAVDIKLSPFHYVLDDTTAGPMIVTDPGSVTIEGVSTAKTVISVQSGDTIEPFEVTDNAKSEGAVLFLSDLTIEGGDASFGGALYVPSSNSSAVITNVDLRSNRSASAGGAIFSAGRLWVSHSTIAGNRGVLAGGGIFSDGGSLVIVNSEITGNVTTETGGGVLEVGGVLSIAGGSVSSNTAGTSSTVGLGGGIAADDAVLSLSGTIVNSNKALDSGTGGGIMAELDHFSMHGGELSFNSASSAGMGGAAFLSAVEATFTDVTINSNTGQIGGVMADEGAAPATIEGKPTVVDVTGGSISHNTSIGAYAVSEAPGSAVDLDIASSVVDDNSTTAGNHTTCAAVCAIGALGGAVQLTLTNDSIEKNSTKEKTETSGAIEAVSVEGAASVVMQGDTVDDNSAPGAALSAGAALFASVSSPSATPPVYSPISIDITNSTFEHDSVGPDGDGGAIGVESDLTMGDVAEASLSMSGDTFEHDSAGAPTSTLDTSGGAVAVDGVSTGSITASTFTDNAAKGKEAAAGAAIVDSGMSTFSFSNDTFTSNSAGELAGALAVIDSESDTITKSSFTDNYAVHAAPALAIFETTFFVSDSTFNEGSVSILAGSGGAIWSEDADGVVSNSTISDNSAGKNGLGGGIFAAGSELTVDSDTITSNVAKTGSALYTDNNGQVVSIKNSIISHNTTKAVGGTENDCGLSTGSGSTAVAAASEGGNLLGSSNCVLELALGDKISKSPDLGGLANNGGPTKTMKPGATSPARAIGLACLATDQRGQPRPATNCDSGSYELIKA